MEVGFAQEDRMVEVLVARQEELLVDILGVNHSYTVKK